MPSNKTDRHGLLIPDVSKRFSMCVLRVILFIGTLKAFVSFFLPLPPANCWGSNDTSIELLDSQSRVTKCCVLLHMHAITYILLCTRRSRGCGMGSVLQRPIDFLGLLDANSNHRGQQSSLVACGGMKKGIRWIAKSWSVQKIWLGASFKLSSVCVLCLFKWLPPGSSSHPKKKEKKKWHSLMFTCK